MVRGSTYGANQNNVNISTVFITLYSQVSEMKVRQNQSSLENSNFSEDKL